MNERKMSSRAMAAAKYMRRKAQGGIIKDVFPDSIASELGLEPGDKLLAIDGQAILDYIDYKFKITEEEVEIEVQKRDGQRLLISIEKDYDEDLGIGFEQDTFDGIEFCQNKCVFCFLDQMPEGLRPELYIRDDDYRLSFLHGNFITLTNMSEEEIDRVIEQKLSPIYISVHSTSPEIRVKLLGNRGGHDILKQLERFLAAGIDIHTQVVVVPGINDGENLQETISDLVSLGEGIESIAIVPVGLTKYRENLADLRVFSQLEAKEVIRSVDTWQEKLLKKHQRRIIYAADEFYALAGMDVPMAEYYEGYPQLENGIGLLRSFIDEFMEELADSYTKPLDMSIRIVTGVSPAPYLKDLIDSFKERVRDAKIEVHPVKNRFFGPTVTVTGLTTGKDIIGELKDVSDDLILLPEVMVRESDNRHLLDGMTMEELQERLTPRIRIVPVDGGALLRVLTEELFERREMDL